MKTTAELRATYIDRINALPSQFPALNALRVAAAFMVFILHLNYFDVAVWKGFVGEFFWLYEVGYVAVRLFFVLSAFLLTLHWLKTPRYGEFMSKRFWRIAPTYYFSLVIVFGAVFVAGAASGKDWVIQLWQHLFFVSGTSSVPGFGVNPVYWSLSVEMAAYLLLPLLVRITLGVVNYIGVAILLSIPVLWKLLVVYVVTQEWMDPYTANYAWYAFPSFIFDFAVGILCAKALVEGFHLPAMMRHVAIPAGLLVLLVSVFPGSGTTGFITGAIVPVLCGWLLLSTLNSQPIASWASKPTISYLSNISYGFYIWHAFIIYVVVSLGGTNFLVAFSAALSLSLVASATSYRWTKPLHA
ncbi:acyltransferase [Devosia sp.]|uniref:acyltransferase family protein n=1 Tax=Devosia sp. TaxID=1871048 RepID=UPI002733C929|nr:acyltransferase [Devosia sp.]MDP2779157.1 acyltransferase [Devosia sp.]